MVGSVEVVTAVVFGATLCILGYATFWALSIKRALRVPLYSNHALGVAVVALGFGLLDVETPFINFGVLIVPVLFLTLFSVFLLMFYFVDTAILSARRADPLLRDTARWKRLRNPLWLVMFVSVALAIGTSVAGYSGFGGIFLIPFIIVGVSGAVVLPRAARRSKDATFNRHLRWFGGFIVLAVGWFFASFLVSQLAAGGMNPATLLNAPLTDVQNYLEALAALVGLAGGGYCLYRSARSLVPLNRIPPES